MPLKGRIQADHMPANKYELIMVGLLPITVTAVSGLETEVGVIELPDRTKATGGQPGPSEITVRVPMHHTLEIAAMDAWHQEAQDPVTPTYKKPGTLAHLSLSGANVKTYNLLGAWVSKRKLPDLSFEDAGAMNEVEYTIQVDSVLPA